MSDKKDIYISVNKRFIEIFALIRELHFLKRQELCDILDVQYSNLSKFEKGERHIDLANVVNMTSKFGVSPTYLLTGEGEIFTSKAEAQLLLDIEDNVRRREDQIRDLRKRFSEVAYTLAQERKGIVTSRFDQETNALRKEIEVLQSQIQDKDLIIQLLKSKLNMS
ncbi:helix-turn-helix domain-containing protein [Hymenobacter sp. HD11105]